MKNTPYTQNMAPYAANTETIGMDTSDYVIGGQINKCIPAKWWNYLFNNLVNRARQSRNDINVIYQEFLNVLNEAGITPDETESDQLLQALEAIRDAKPLATQNILGRVKSSGGKSFVSVGADGTMTANGVGSITSDSNSGITLNPSVEDIISALNFLASNIAGHEIAIPLKPETWAIETAVITDDSDNESTGDAVYCAPRGSSIYRALTVPAGWHRICIWGGSGGRGGSAGSAMWGGRTSAYNSSDTYSTGSLQGTKAGESGSAGRTIMLDVYLPTETKFMIVAGGGGNPGNSGTNGWVSSRYSTDSDYSAGVAGTRAVPVTATRGTITRIGTRYPSFIEPSYVGSNGQNGGSGGMSTSGSYVSFNGRYAYGGTGGSGGCGGGTVVKFGASVLCASGGDGGAGAGRDSKSGSVSPLGSGYGSCSYYIPSASGGSSGYAQYVAQVRLPFVLGRQSTGAYFFSPIDMPVYTGDYPHGYIARYLVAEKFKLTVSSTTCTLSFRENTDPNQTPVYSPAYSWTVQTGVSELNGLGGGIAIFKGANT